MMKMMMPKTMPNMKMIQDIDVFEKRILVRCDFNVPLNEDGTIGEDFKIKKTLPTINYLLKQNAKIILMSHLDQLENGIMPKMDVVKNRLQELLGIDVKKADDCVGEKVLEVVNNLQAGEILLLENLRTHKEETENSDNFAKELANLADIYINDAFAVCHRAHASVVGVPKYLPHAFGFLLQEEIKNLDKILKNPDRPLVVLVGGAKVETKYKFIESISKTADLVLIGGLLKKEISEENIQFKNSEKIIGPVDNLDAKDLNEKTIELFCQKIAGAKTILWNGPFGLVEDEAYKKGTLELAKAIVKSTAFSVVGGGETIEFLNKEGMLDRFSYVSTGGGAMLDYLSDGQLPGLKALN